MGNDWNWLAAKWEKTEMDDEMTRLRNHAKWSRRMARIALALSIFAVILSIVK